jgi:hypothetical protein
MSGMGGLNIFIWSLKQISPNENREKIFLLVNLNKFARFLVDGKHLKIIHTKDYYVNSSLAENQYSGIVKIVLLDQSAYLNGINPLVSETERKSDEIIHLKIQSIFLEQSMNIIVHTVINRICFIQYGQFCYTNSYQLLLFNYVLLST